MGWSAVGRRYADLFLSVLAMAGPEHRIIPFKTWGRGSADLPVAM